MSGWKSRWSWLRLVKTEAVQWMPSARRSSSACEEISIAHATSPASSISRNVRWRSIASGVVRSIARRSPPTIEATVPSRPHCIPAASSIARTSQAVVVLPLVPVTPTTAQLRGRVAGEAGGGLRHRGAHVLDLDLRHAEPERPADHERRRATRDRVRREVMPVAGEAGDAEEQRPGLDLAVVVGEARDLDVGAVAEQLAQRHRAESMGAPGRKAGARRRPRGARAAPAPRRRTARAAARRGGSGTP